MFLLKESVNIDYKGEQNDEKRDRGAAEPVKLDVGPEIDHDLIVDTSIIYYTCNACSTIY